MAKAKGLAPESPLVIELEDPILRGISDEDVAARSINHHSLRPDESIR